MRCYANNVKEIEALQSSDCMNAKASVVEQRDELVMI